LQTVVCGIIHQTKYMGCDFPWHNSQISALYSSFVHMKCTSHMAACYHHRLLRHIGSTKTHILYDNDVNDVTSPNVVHDNDNQSGPTPTTEFYWRNCDDAVLSSM